jgi:hypothetical protein
MLSRLISWRRCLLFLTPFSSASLRLEEADLQLLSGLLVPFFYLQFVAPLCGPKKALFAGQIQAGVCGSGGGALPE